MKLKIIMLFSLVSFGFATIANAGSVADDDTVNGQPPGGGNLAVGDLVPNSFDNCLYTRNGPNQTSNQVDTDQDGYGNACDADYDNDFIVTSADFGVFLGSFGFPGALTDHDGDGFITAADFGVFLSQLSSSPGPSGLGCAGSPMCTP